MRISLASSLHLNHGARSLDARGGEPLTMMQAFVPVGLLSLKAACNVECPAASVEVLEVNTLLNAAGIGNDDRFYDHLADAILGRGDDVVGLMTDSDSLHHTIAIARRIKARAPCAMVGLGGPAASPVARRILERFDAVDFIVRGEGEETFGHLIKTLEAGQQPHQVAGITWRSGTDILHNPDRKVIEDLDRLPIPDFGSYPGIADAALYLDVGRGCPFSCTFCTTAPFWERRYRMKSIPRILDEMRLLRDRWGRRHFNYSHDIFTCDQKWTHKFCDAMKSAGLGVTWSCSTRTDVIDPELLAHMAEAGCVEIYYGIETGSQAMQHTISKDLDLGWSREIVRATAACGIRPVTGFIIGYPQETHETISDTVARFFDFLQVGDFRAHIFTLCPFPGAPMFKQAAPSIDRRAEYLDLPLASGVAQEADRTIEQDREIFASQFRFASPGVPQELIAAAEELSPHLVLLKRLWPLMLQHYDAPITLFRRWASWIAERNGGRPWRATHHGDARDLIDFVAHELGLLKIADNRIYELMRYEAAKLAAAALPAGDADGEDLAEEVERTSVLGPARPYLLAAFGIDIGSLVAGRSLPANDIPLPQWVVFARDPTGTLDTMVISDAARRALEQARRPRPASELVQAALLDRVGETNEPFDHGLDVVRTLVARKLLKEVKAS